MQGNRFRSICAWFLYALALVQQGHAIELDVNSEQSLKNAASEATYGAMRWYHGNETGAIPGAFPTKWWEGSALFLAVLNYWHFTGDTTYNDELSVGLQWQGGENCDYMPSNYSSYLGNDDQMFWGLAAMQAAELKLPDRKTGCSWLALAQGVFNTQRARWDMSTCEGGLRWQLYVYQSGYTLKNAVSNGGFFQLAARLARYTNDPQYLEWAKKVWEWSESTPMLNTKTWFVADSTNPLNGCKDAGRIQWTYNYGVYFMGAAYLYDYTGDEMWLRALNGLIDRLFKTFFIHNNVIEDVTCEPREICNNNEILFKGLVVSWLSYTTLLVPSTAGKIMPMLESSAKACAASCTGNGNNTCGVRWYQSKWDGWTGMEEQISASQMFSAMLVKYAKGKDVGPVTENTGGTSNGNVNAGMGDGSGQENTLPPITTGDKAGAGILTVAFVGGWIGLMVFMLMGA